MSVLSSLLCIKTAMHRYSLQMTRLEKMLQTTSRSRQISNIFEEDGFQHPNITTDPIRIRIHTYLTQEQRELYLPGAFIYADGRFSTALWTDGTLEISKQSLSRMWHAAPNVPASSG